MDKLELKHLAKRLPYGVKLFDIYDNRVTELLGLDKSENMLCYYLNGLDEDWANLEAFKPILFPLSALTQEITIKGETFVPIYNWVLANAVLYDEPVFNVKGKLSFWEYEK